MFLFNTKSRAKANFECQIWCFPFYVEQTNISITDFTTFKCHKYINIRAVGQRTFGWCVDSMTNIGKAKWTASSANICIWVARSEIKQLKCKEIKAQKMTRMNRKIKDILSKYAIRKCAIFWPVKSRTKQILTECLCDPLWLCAK